MFDAQVVKTQREHVHMHVNAPGDATVHVKHFLAPWTWGCAAVGTWMGEPTVCLLFPGEHYLRLSSQSQNQSGGIIEFRNSFTVSMLEWESASPYTFSDAQIV